MEIQAKGHILVVEDDEAVRSALVGNLESAGFRVVQASNGNEGLALLRAFPNIRLVLLDLMMPGLDGWQFRREQLADKHLASVPTVLVTGSAAGRLEVERLHAAGYVQKPVTREQLIKVALQYCS